MDKTTSISNNRFFAEVDALIKQGRSVRLKARGNSMLPLLRSGDEVLLVPPTSDNVKLWMPVLAHTDEKGIVLHRIVKIDGAKITLAGDGNVIQFEHTVPERIIAVATHYYRGKKSLQTDTCAMRLFASLWYWALPCRRIVVKAGSKIKRFFR